MDKRVLIVAPVHKALIEEIESWGYGYYQLDEQHASEAIALIANYDGLITSTRLIVDSQFLDKATKLQWIGRMGSGMEQIDVAYAQGKGIACFSSPEGNANAVAEQALGMLLCLQHNVFKAHNNLLQGQWLREENRGVEIEGLTAGIIGYGNNGAAFARKLAVMGVHVLAYDKYKTINSEANITGIQNLDTLYDNADIVSFHVPLNAETKHYFNHHFLNQMQKRFVLLNLSRGAVVHFNTLLTGLQSGKIKSAAIDVWEQEPFFDAEPTMEAAYKEIIKMPNVIGTPHIGGYTFDALYKMSKFLIEKIKTHLNTSTNLT